MQSNHSPTTAWACSTFLSPFLHAHFTCLLCTAMWCTKIISDMLFSGIHSLVTPLPSWDIQTKAVHSTNYVSVVRWLHLNVYFRAAGLCHWKNAVHSFVCVCVCGKESLAFDIPPSGNIYRSRIRVNRDEGRASKFIETRQQLLCLKSPLLQLNQFSSTRMHSFPLSWAQSISPFTPECLH